MERKHQQRPNVVSFSIDSRQNPTHTLFIDAHNGVLISFYYWCYFVIYSFPRPPSTFNRSTSEEAAVGSQAFLHAAEHCQHEPEELFPCCITADRTVTITVWTLLMIFTFTLRFFFVERGNHLHFARQVCSQGKRNGQHGSVFGIFPSSCCFMDGWKGLIGFPLELPSCCGEYLSIIVKDVKNEGWEPLGRVWLRL